MKLWLDDVRPAPQGWMWAKDNATAKSILEACGVTGHVAIHECSLDHDLGALPTGDTDPREVMFLQGDSPDGSGYDLAVWMCENGLVPDIVTIHSWNPAGARRMRATFYDHGYETTLRPFQL